MAKVVGLVGSASGKIGNVVYCVNNGIQVARVYQPIVSNPKSDAQLLQRAKANLVGRLSSITPREAILGLGTSNRARRAEFLRNGLAKASATFSEGVFTAKLQPSNLQFSKGAVTPVFSVNSVQLSGAGTVLISYHRLAYIDYGMWTKAGGYFVLVAIDDETGNYDLMRVYNWARPGFPTSDSDVMTVSLSMQPVSEHQIFVYFVPFASDTSKGSARTNGLFLDAAEYAATMGLTAAAALMNFGYSEYLGQAVQGT